MRLSIFLLRIHINIEHICPLLPGHQNLKLKQFFCFVMRWRRWICFFFWRRRLSGIQFYMMFIAKGRKRDCESKKKKPKIFKKTFHYFLPSVNFKISGIKTKQAIKHVKLPKVIICPKLASPLWRTKERAPKPMTVVKTEKMTGGPTMWSIFVMDLCSK